MANNYEQIMALVNAGNKMGLSNTITRDNGIPLDLSSIYATYEDAVIYAATKAIAYQDQIVAAEGIAYIIVAESQGQVTVGETVYENYLKPIGTIPGFDDAANGTVAIKQDGSLVWKTLEEIGAGDGNDNTTYTFTGVTNEAGEVYGIKIQAYFNGVEQGDPVELALTVYTKAEADAKFALKGEDAYDDTALDARVAAIEADYLTTEDKYDDTALSNRVTAIEEDIADHETRISKVEEFFVTAEGETLDAALDTLIEIQKYIDQDGEVAEQVLANTAAIETLNGDATTAGSVDKKIADAIAPLATTESVNTALADKADKTALAGYYTKTESDEKYALASVAATKNELAEVSTVANNAAQKVDTLEDKIDEIIADGGEPNVIEYIQVNGVAQTVTDKTVNIAVPTEVADLSDGATLKATVSSNTTLAQKGVDDAAAAKGVADAAAAQAETNKTDIAGHLTRIGALETTVGGHVTSISSLEGRVTTLEGEDAKINEAIGTLQGKVTALQGEDSRLAGLIGANTTEIGKKANAADVYTKTETDTAISDAIADIPAVDLTPYLKSADAANTYATIAAVESIYKAGEGEAAATGLLAEEIARAKAAEQANADAIALLTENPTEAIDSVKELIDYVNNHGATVEGINNRLDGHDALLAGIGGDGEPATVAAAIEAAAYELPAATAEILGGIKSAANDAEDKVAVNKVYVDATTNVGEVKAVSTDTLVNGANTLILYGGSATV